MKPPYRVLSMAEVEATPPNGLVAVSTFAGAGGSCTGYRMAGFRVAWANEFEPNAVETYRANHPDTVLGTRDIRNVAGAEILAQTGLDEVDLLDGPARASRPPASGRATGAR
jgi:DNA (cytosine-5)-methyltransferase 1